MTWSNTAYPADRGTKLPAKSYFAGHPDSSQVRSRCARERLLPSSRYALLRTSTTRFSLFKAHRAAGKTYTGARMICELVRNGARVGVTARQP